MDKNKKGTINHFNKENNKCFQRSKKIKKDPQRITKNTNFANKYNWKRINFPSEKDNWKNCEKNNRTIALNVLYAENKKIYQAYVSKDNSNREKQVLLLMIANRKGRHYLTVQELPELLWGIASKYHGGFYDPNCLHFFSKGNKRESHKKKGEKKDFCTNFTYSLIRLVN